MLKIAFILPGTTLSGGVKVVLELCNVLAKFPGIKPYLFTPHKSLNWFSDPILFPIIQKEYHQLNLEEFGVVITTFFNQREIFYKWQGKKFFHLCQGYEGDYLKEMNKEELKDEILEFYNLSYPKLTVNNFLKERLKKITKANVYTVGMGINRSIFSPSTSSKKNMVLIVGPSELEFKGVKNSLKLAALLKKDFPYLKITRISPVDTYNLEKESFPIDNFLTSISPHKMGEFYRKALLSIYLPSKEGFGLPVLESVSCKTPVLASNIPPFKEMFSKTNYPLFVPGDIANAFYFAKRLIKDKAYYKYIAQQGLKISKRYSYVKMATKFLFFCGWESLFHKGGDKSPQVRAP